MARSSLHRRDIGPGYWDNEDLVDLGTFARFFFMAMWCQADREGRLEDRPRRIRLKANMLDLEAGQAEVIMDNLAELGFVIRYEAEGKRYVQITNFAKHQKIHPRERSSEIPGPEGAPRANPGRAQGEPRANPGQTLGEPRCAQGGTFPSGPSGPSGTEEERRAREGKSGPSFGLPPEAINLASTDVPTDKQMDEVAKLAESTGIPAEDMLAATIYETWTRRSAGVVIDRYYREREKQRRAAGREPPKKSKARNADDVIREIYGEEGEATG